MEGAPAKDTLKRVAAAAIALAVAAAVVVGGLYLRAPRATRIGVGDPLPDFTLPRVMDGGPEPSRGLRGGPALLVFFDMRSPGAERYLLYLERLYRHRYRRGLRMLAVSLDTDVESVREFARKANLTFVLVSDPGAATVAPVFGVPRDPEAYFLGPNGRVEKVFIEQIDLTDPLTHDLLEKYLEPQS